MNIPQTIVAIMTLASESEEVSEEQVEQIAELLRGASQLEVTVLIASLANIQNYALTLLEQNSKLSKEAFIRDLGLEILEEESGGS